MTSEPLVDVVIAVHDPRRPIARAVASVLDRNRVPLRVTVVVHNTDSAPISAALEQWGATGRLRILHLADGVPSPSGPFNLGLDEATAPYSSVMGSDDFLEPGAVDSWVGRARREQAAAVITRLRHDSGALVPTPPVRPARSARFDLVKDRLAYRSAPLGLIERDRLGDLRFETGIPVGEDLPYVCQAWARGPVAFDRKGPAYVIGSDAADRVTFTRRSIADEFSYLPAVLDSTWFTALDADGQSAIVVKFLRIHVFGSILNRPEPQWWDATERALLSDATGTLLARGHGIESVLSRADARVLAAIADPTVPARELLAAAVDRRSFLRPAALLPTRLSRALHREAPLRMMAASWLVGRQ